MIHYTAVHAYFILRFKYIFYACNARKYNTFDALLAGLCSEEIRTIATYSCVLKPG